MTFSMKTLAAAAALLIGGGGAASAQPYYGYGELPPAPYQTVGGYAYGGYGGGCDSNRFTLLGAHAGVTVLGFDLGAGAALNAPFGGGYCGGYGGGEAYVPRPYAPPVAYAPPPQPYGYEQPGYGYEQPAYAQPSYAPPAYGPPPQAYPCGCEGRGW